MNAAEYRKNKKLAYKPNQIGGMMERIEKALGRDIDEDERTILELLVMPEFCKDQFGSSDRKRAAFERVLNRAEESALELDRLFAKINKENDDA